ncbi:MAG: universal stress protein [Proteobacteria bacterium]|nr:universal stress protein [Pseudomonadota bacterium]
MTIRTVLAPLGSARDSSQHLASAFVLAKRLSAHIDVFHISPDPRDSVAYVGEGVTGAIIEDLMSAAEQEGDARATQSEEQFQAVCTASGATVANVPSGTGFTAAFATVTGRIYDLVALRGRLADVTVVPRPQKVDDAMVQATLEVALLETGRPVLVVPPKPIEDLGKRVVILWSGAEEAARAVAGALPLLRQAESVAAYSFTRYAKPLAQAADLVSYLAWHGIKVSTHEDVETAGRDAEDVAFEKVSENNADLVVMGAYTHSRLRHLIFGGMTSAMLERAEVPVFMAH